MDGTYDVIIIGAGTAGLSALREVRRHTDDFLLINAGSWGTTCAEVGCMPSKALIEAARAYRLAQDFSAFGLRGAEGVAADMPAVLRRVRRLRDGFVKGPKETAEELGDRALSARARLIGPDCVEADGRELRARRIILATGSAPIVPGSWRRFGDRILTTDTIFEQEDLPRRLAVVGMGAIGVELAQALAYLGLEVAGFDSEDACAGASDPEIARVSTEALRRSFRLCLGADAELDEHDDGIAVSAGENSFVADAVLVAIGRKPNIDDLGLDALGVALDEHGMPDVDPTTLQVGDLPVFLAGDANGELQLLHEAADDGHIAGRNSLAEQPVRYRRRTPLAIVFSEPGLARVGRGFAELESDEAAVGGVDFSRQGRVRMAERAEGMARIYADKATGKLLGAEMCAPAAEHMAHLLALAIERELTVHDMLAMPFYHPVLEEGLRTALRDVARQLTALEDVSDLAHCPEMGIDALE